MSLVSIESGDGNGEVATQLKNPQALKNIRETRSLVGNATVLPYDSWKEIDRVVIEEMHLRTVGVQDLLDRNLIKRTRGLGATVLQWQDESDGEEAEVAMDGITRANRSRLERTTNFLPLPIIFSDVSFSAREIAPSSDAGEAIDTSTVREASRQVTEKMEKMLFQGHSLYTAGGGTIYGYEDHPDRNTGSLTANWDSSASNGVTIRNDVANMLQTKRDARMHGDGVLYVPTAYQKVLDDDYRANYAKSTLTRLLELQGLSDVKVSDQLTANNVMLVEMNESVVRLAIGMDIQTIHWSTEGLTQNFKVMGILIPNIRSTQAGRSGIVHYT